MWDDEIHYASWPAGHAFPVNMMNANGLKGIRKHKHDKFITEEKIVLTIGLKV